MEENIFRLPSSFRVSKTPIYRRAFSSDVYDWNTLMMNLHNVHQTLTGKGTKVGILDTGFFEGHPDLDDDVEAKHFIGPDVTDGDGHGTHVRGTIVMQKNGKGYVGVAPDGKAAIAKVLHLGFGNSTSVAEGMEWCIEVGCTVINGSLGAPKWDNRIAEAVELAYQNHIPMVFASGNENADELSFPASHPRVFSVGAIDANKVLAWFSNRGVDLFCVAAGVAISSTWIDGDYRKAEGTSMAAPHVSGLIMLIQQWFLEHEGRLPSCEELKEIMIKDAEDLNIEGKDAATGNGLVTTNFADKKPADYFEELADNADDTIDTEPIPNPDVDDSLGGCRGAMIGGSLGVLLGSGFIYTIMKILTG